MNRNEHKQLLAQQYQDLKKQFLDELLNGNSLPKIRDISYVLDMLAQELRGFEGASNSRQEDNRRHVVNH